MIRDPEKLIGKRYTCEFRVVEVEPGPPGLGTRQITLYMYGEKYTLSLEEVSTLIETGFVMEVEER